MKRLVPVLLLLLALSPLTVACRQPAAVEEHAYHLAPLSQLPADVRQAPSVVREAYQFAFYNPELLQQLPCTCGCAGLGHTSNYSCYVSGVDQNGLPLYDNHAVDCRICVDITQDAMRLLDEGQSLAQIQSKIDATYLPLGPSTGHQ